MRYGFETERVAAKYVKKLDIERIRFCSENTGMIIAERIGVPSGTIGASAEHGSTNRERALKKNRSVEIGALERALMNTRRSMR